MTAVGREIASLGMRRRKDSAGMEQDHMRHPQVLATVYPSCLSGGARSMLSESGYKGIANLQLGLAPVPVDFSYLTIINSLILYVSELNFHHKHASVLQ